MKNKSGSQRKIAGRNLFLAIAVFLTAGLFTSNAFAANPDFSGTWKLNEGKSELGEGRFRPSMILEVKQDKTTLTVVRVRTGRDGQERKMESVYNLSGKETTSGEGNRSVTSTAKWSADGKTLVIHSKRSFTRDGQTMEFETDETWTLNGKVLTIQSTSNSPRGERTTKMVYDKSS